MVEKSKGLVLLHMHVGKYILPEETISKTKNCMLTFFENQRQLTSRKAFSMNTEIYGSNHLFGP